jgi:hypothetical protein
MKKTHSHAIGGPFNKRRACDIYLDATSKAVLESACDARAAIFSHCSEPSKMRTLGSVLVGAAAAIHASVTMARATVSTLIPPYYDGHGSEMREESYMARIAKSTCEQHIQTHRQHKYLRQNTAQSSPIDTDMPTNY